MRLGRSAHGASVTEQVAGAGFEPAKAEPTRLQRVPFDRSGTPPGRIEHSDQRDSGDGSGRPGSISNSEYFGPPTRSPVPPETTPAGVNHRPPSPARPNRRPPRDGLNPP